MSGISYHKKLPHNETHKILDGIEYKLCLLCEEWNKLNTNNFYKNNKSPDGHSPYCKKCSIKKAMKYKYEHHDKFLLGQKKNNARPEVKAKTSILCKLKRERGDERKWRQENKDKIKKYNEIRKNKNHNISKLEWQSCLEYFNHSCAYCGIPEDEAKKNQGQYLHKEHVEHEGANDLSNCIPACRSCNSQKWTFNIDDWYNQDNPIFDLERFDNIHNWLDNDYKDYIKDNN